MQQSQRKHTANTQQALLMIFFFRLQEITIVQLAYFLQQADRLARYPYPCQSGKMGVIVSFFTLTQDELHKGLSYQTSDL